MLKWACDLPDAFPFCCFPVLSVTGGRKFTVQGTNNAFTCANCGADVQPLRNGSVRNHCPACLHSLHVDIQPGDRACDCHGVMVPVGLDQSGKKGWMVIHQCAKCGFTGRNRAALDDPDQPDDWDALIALSRRGQQP